MEQLRERFSEAISQGFRHDVGVIVVRSLELGRKLIETKSSRAHEHTEVILHTAILRGDEVTERHVRLVGVFFGLLAERVESVVRRCPAFIRVNDDVIANGVGRVETINTLESKSLVLLDFCDHRVGLVEELLRLGADSFIVENLRVATVRVATTQLPHLEERIPVNVRKHIVDRHLNRLGSAELGSDRDIRRGGEVHRFHSCSRLLEGKVFTIL